MTLKAETSSIQLLETKIDDVVEFIQKKGRTNLGEVSREMGIDRDKLEHIVDLLEEKGIIKVKYGLVNGYLYTEEENNSTPYELIPAISFFRLQGRKRKK